MNFMKLNYTLNVEILGKMLLSNIVNKMNSKLLSYMYKFSSAIYQTKFKTINNNKIANVFKNRVVLEQIA